MSWIFLPGYYTHSPVTGQRVAQYGRSNRRSCPPIRRTRRAATGIRLIQVGTEWLNLVQTWGAGTAIRPYGEWEYPYRAGATPFGPWGNPQGPWTLPFDSWRNPYGLNRSPYGYGQGSSGYGPGGYGAWQSGQQAMPPPADAVFWRCDARADARAARFARAGTVGRDYL